MNPNSFEILATIFFAIAVVHTFFASRIHAWGSRFPDGSFAENSLHLLGEVEVVFGLWGAIFLALVALNPSLGGPEQSLAYLEGVNLNEAGFVFVIMAIASTRPIISLAEISLRGIARLLPLPPRSAQIAMTLSLGTLFGSLITEPAAMTVCALLLGQTLFSQKVSNQLRYGALAVLFVNISVGGLLTPFAAPPVLMVARAWGWDLGAMLSMFGFRAVAIVVANTTIFMLLFRKELASLDNATPGKSTASAPLALSFIHLAILAAVVASVHHPRLFAGIFLAFLAVVQVTREYQDELRLREALLVAFFLGGLVLLGQPQQWWLLQAADGIGNVTLFLGSAGMTAVLDNAALTYLGTQIPSLEAPSRYFLVAGAVAGGGLTVIANAPNPIGFSILHKYFNEDGISPLRLLLAAIIPTLVALLCFAVGT